eukprot:8789284-Lingulodinium_polyedra.AAC.1
MEPCRFTFQVSCGQPAVVRADLVKLRCLRSVPEPRHQVGSSPSYRRLVRGRCRGPCCKQACLCYGRARAISTHNRVHIAF